MTVPAAINVRNLTFRVRRQKLVPNLLSFANCLRRLCQYDVINVINVNKLRYVESKSLWPCKIDGSYPTPKIVFNAPWKYSTEAQNISVLFRNTNQTMRPLLEILCDCLQLHVWGHLVKTPSEFIFC